MVEVRLHGALAQQFGQRWDLDISTPLEAVRAIECARAGFRAAITRLSQAGMVFRVRSRSHDYSNEDVGVTLGSATRLDIIPIVGGASAGLRFVVGAVLTAVGTMNTLVGSPLGIALTSTGISLMLGAVTEWLTKVPKREEMKNTQSWTLSGPTNTVEQGLPVPIAYGETLIGGYTISAGIAVAQMQPNGTIEPAVNLGGNFNPIGYASSPGTYTMVVQISASPFNISEPLTYAWSYTGFSRAAARRLVTSNKATLRLELDYAFSNTAVGGFYRATVEDVGTVTCRITGKDTNDTGTEVRPARTEEVAITVSSPYNPL